jgi:hypothetical protein
MSGQVSHIPHRRWSSRVANNSGGGHPELASFADEGSAFGIGEGKKQVPHPVQKANGVRNDKLNFFEGDQFVDLVAVLR